MMIGSAMCSAYTDAMNLTGTLCLPIISISASCQHAPSMASTATVERLEGNQFMVSLDIQRGNKTIASPQVLCMAGQNATIELVDGQVLLTIEVHPPATGDGGPVHIDIRWIDEGLQALTQHIEVSDAPPT